MLGIILALGSLYFVFINYGFWAGVLWFFVGLPIFAVLSQVVFGLVFGGSIAAVDSVVNLFRKKDAKPPESTSKPDDKMDKAA